jgi:AraC-like DNA-binding protein/mannose-6-phosphate isomerase-like protein (cupin superfamily)
MALQICGLNINDTKKELQPHGTVEFPCAGYEDEYTESPDDIIPWHWHDEMELACITKGTMCLKVPGKEVRIGQGGLVFINSGIPHYAQAEGSFSLQSLVFSPLLLTGTSTSAFAAKYVNGITACREASVHLFPEETADVIRERFRQAFEALRDDVFGYEFIVREQLSRIVLELAGIYQDRIEARDHAASPDEIRIEQMLDYIHGHYHEELELEDIAGAANIGARECLRCFRRTANESPIQYLMRYRLMQGAARLVTEPSESIAEVAVSCGFSSPSYFTKMFKRYYKKTPNQYRKADRGVM